MDHTLPLREGRDVTNKQLRQQDKGNQQYLQQDKGNQQYLSMDNNLATKSYVNVREHISTV
jgi:hypothetical protein